MLNEATDLTQRELFSEEELDTPTKNQTFSRLKNPKSVDLRTLVNDFHYEFLNVIISDLEAGGMDPIEAEELANDYSVRDVVRHIGQPRVIELAKQWEAENDY